MMEQKKLPVPPIGVRIPKGSAWRPDLRLINTLPEARVSFGIGRTMATTADRVNGHEESRLFDEAVLEAINGLLRMAERGCADLINLIDDGYDTDVRGVTVYFDGEFPLTNEQELPGALREAGSTYAYVCEQAARRAERELAKGNDHLKPQERSTCHRLAARIRREINKVAGSPITFVNVPMVFNPDDLPSADDGLLYGLTVQVEGLEIVADFRKQPEHVIAARLRDVARAYETIAANLER